MLNENFILVVDDNDGIRHLLKEFLTQEGFNVKTASSGFEALQVVHHSLPLLVLLDSKMPGMNGFEILKKLKEKSLNLPVIMISAYTQQKQINEALNVGILNDFIAKPFDLLILLNKLQSIVTDIEQSSL